MAHVHRATVNGRVVRYFEAGSGRPLLLIHAFPYNAEMWRPQLAQVPDGWRFVAPDLRGFGGTLDEGTPALTLDDHADDLLGFLDALEIDSPVVGGLSMGGYITFALFRRAPERIAGMVLADTRPQVDSPDGRRGRQALLDLLHSRGVGAVADDLLGKQLGQTTLRERPEVAAEVRRLIESSSPRAIEAAVTALLSRPDSTPDLARIRCPTLVIVGAEDTITPPADAEAMYLALGSVLVVIPGAGHVSNLEAPGAFNAALAAWCGRAAS